jgi:hypothetical protein
MKKLCLVVLALGWTTLYPAANALAEESQKIAFAISKPLQGYVVLTEEEARASQPDPNGFREAAHRYCNDGCHFLTVIDFISSIPDDEKRKQIWKRMLRDRFVCPYPELYASQLAYLKSRDIAALERMALISGLPLR